MTQWLTRQEAADHMSVSARTIDRWSAEGRLQRYRIEGLRSVRYRADDLDSLPQLVPADEAIEPDVADEPQLDAQGYPTTPCSVCEDEGLLCTHLWCRTCEEWRRDTGAGPDCEHPLRDDR